MTAGDARYQDLASFRVPDGFRGRSKWVTQAWWIVQATIFSWSPQFMYGFRAMLLRLFGASLGKGVLVRASARVTYPWKLHVGSHVWIGDDARIYNLAQVRIGSNVAVAHGAYLCTGSHDLRRSSFDILATAIELEDEVWVASDVFVAAGVRIGRGAVIGARSTVFKDMPGGMICFGSPCVPIEPRRRDDAVGVREGAA